ncbi:putative 2,3-dihydroxybiphenyl-1,2-dioxygenase or glyoxalase/bleomycin resistance protein-like protein [Dactylonectria estremocensis]|uniref:2,3-dihydroxybiphenyl-1,2-dioxygenase or glyoxalase/bleomycin resistance protein-like protein n=1 Tax=Dactylonectria estremocensis TaxID=1079267 RepID=A0A9P9DT17_9HYPO|nr:putative 2,3-dihydroxybiphenyl-1,2-dioxygenase or glyoxalase/bleomycin resistance protein-like protein [Dactylonectria estremocensis]
MSNINHHASKVRLDRLLYTHYRHANLTSAHAFLTDFGLHVAEKRDTIIYYRGFGANPFIFVAEQSPDNVNHFVRSGWLARTREDLEVAAQIPGASSIQWSDAPGEGWFVDIRDPNGVSLRIHHGIKLRSAEEVKKEIPKPVTFNSWSDKPRKGEFQRFDIGPSKIHKLGHYGLVVDKSKFTDTVAWYLGTFSLAKTDSLFDKDSGEDVMTFMHIDKGKEFTDHHSFFIQSPPPPVSKSYPHHSSFEVDNVDSQLTGHYHLEDKHWTNCWGVGRHLLGSQIFDYWFDPSGNILEHYADGDLVNSENEVTREAAAPDTMAVWGPNVPLAFLTTRMEDILKGAAVPDMEHSAVAP